MIGSRLSTTSIFCATSASISRSIACCRSISVKLRLERQHELSFLEFNYMILQAYDFVELHKRTAACCRWAAPTSGGNIVNGIDLGRRMANAQLFALIRRRCSPPLVGPRWARLAGRALFGSMRIG